MRKKIAKRLEGVSTTIAWTKKIGEAPQFVKKLNPKMAFFRKMNLEIGKFHQKQHIFTHITSKNMF